MTKPTAEDLICDFVAGFTARRLVETERRLVRRAILDTVACGVAGRSEPASVIARSYSRSLAAPGTGASRVWSDGVVFPVEIAAWLNGIAAHVLDYDDVASPLRGHPSVAILPAVIALAEARDLTLAAVEEAYAVGFEITCRIASAVAIGHYEKGWHSTATLGALGGVLSCARLLGLDRGGVCNALGIAMTQLAGTRGNFGSMAKSLQSGQAGQVCVRSVLLAEAGFSGGHAPLAGREGFLRLYTDGGTFDEVLEGLGEAPSALTSVGLEVKKYPLCYATHRALDAVFDLLAAHRIDFDAIATVRVGCSKGAFVPLIHSRPQNGLEAKFSIQYAMAAALHDRKIGLSSFEDAEVLRPKIQSWLPKVSVEEASGAVMPRWAEVAITMADGAVFSQRTEQLRGGALLPLTDAELCVKVKDCFAFGGSDRGGDFSAALLSVDGSTGLRTLLDTLGSRLG